MSSKGENEKKSYYDEAISNLMEVLSAREKDLEAREQELQKIREELDQDRFAAYGDTSPSDVLGLNIGGTKISVLRRTLTSIKDSMLASRFSGRWDDSIEKDKDGNFFIDQEYSMFRFVIKYLRDKENGDDKYPLKSPVLCKQDFGTDDFYRMVEYYGLTEGLYPVEFQEYTTQSTKSLKSRKLDAKEFMNVRLNQVGHSRKIRSYEVKLGTVKRIQIGWSEVDTKISLDQIRANRGAGDINDTIALDLVRSSLLYNGDSVCVDGLEHSEGTLLRSENYGMMWYINGTRVAAPLLEEKWNLFYNKCNASKSARNSSYGNTTKKSSFIPFISVQGDIEVTSVEFEE